MATLSSDDVTSSPSSPSMSDDALIDHVKYGDADLASKKRKQLDDEYNTVFTKRLSAECNLKSTLTTAESSDFIGGLLRPDDSNDEVDNWNVSDPISTHPSSSSCGFENTFKVLEGQLRGSHQLNRQEVDMLLRSSDLRRNPIFLNVPFASKDRFLRAISEESNIPDEHIDEDENTPSFLELELDARQRIKELSENIAIRPKDHIRLSPVNTGAEDVRESSMTEFLYGIAISSSRSTSPSRSDEPLPHISEEIQQQTGEYPEYVYHMAKGKDGRVYLRVVRSLLVDKGNNFVPFITSLSPSHNGISIIIDA